MTEVRTALRRGQIRQPSRLQVDRPVTGWATVVLAPIAIALTVLLVAAATGEAAAADPLRKGDSASISALQSTLMARWVTAPVDLDGDGTDGFLALAGDGVVHLYAPDGRFLWGLDTQDVAREAGLLVTNGGHAFGSYSFLLPESPAGFAVAELTGDSVEDLLIAYAFVEEAPAHALRGAVIKVDGATGALLDVDLHEGIIKTIAVDDLNDDGALELITIEEDGTRHLSPSEDHWLGSDASTIVRVSDLASGTELWAYDTGSDWGHVTSFAVGQLDQTGSDLVFAVTHGAGRFVYDLDLENAPLGQDMIALDGATGNVLWQNQTMDLVREIILTDMDADGDDDLLVHVQQPSAALVSRGDSRAHLEALNGADGSTLWRRIATFGPQPSIFDMAVRAEAVPTVAVAYTITPSVHYSAEQVVRVDLMRLADGVPITGIDLVDETRRPVHDVLSTIGLGRVVSLPADGETIAPVTGMNIVLTDIDADGLRDIVVGNDRGVFALSIGGDELTRAWTDTTRADPFTFFLGQAPSADSIFTHDVAAARIIGFDGATGSRVADHPLYGIMTGFGQADLDTDGVADQVFGGASGAVFAVSGATGDPLWTKAVDETILDLLIQDVDGDGRPDVLAVGTTRMAAIDGQSSGILWAESHLQTADRSRVTTLLFSDLDGNGVRDLVVASGAKPGQVPGVPGAGAVAEVTARSGSTGALLWTSFVPSPFALVSSLATGDLDNDGQPDVTFIVQTADGTAHHSVVAVDGQTGLPMWRVDRPTSATGAPSERNGIAVADADGDGDDDVIVPGRGGRLAVPRASALDGASGLTLWNRTVGVTPGQVEGVFFASLAPGGADAVILTLRNDAGVVLQAIDGRGDPLFTVPYAGLMMVSDVASGDVDGDGIVDVIVAGPQGLAVLDGGRALGGNPDHLGHMVAHAASRIQVADFDGDGYAEVAFLADPGNAPIHQGLRPFTDLGRSKAIGIADLEGIAFPVDLAPTARYLIDTVPPVVNQPVQLRSASSDLDGTIVRERWAFADGTTVDGNVVVRTWSQPGPKSFTLTVIDNDGQSDTIQGVVNIRAVHAFTATPTAHGTYTAPAALRTFDVIVVNTGVQSDTFTPRVSSVSYDWTARIVDPAPFALAAGASKVVQVEVDATSAHPRGLVGLLVKSTATGTEHAVSHRLFMPLQVTGALLGGAGPYAPTDDIGGEVFLTWHDGSPASSIPVRINQDSLSGSSSVATDASGRAFFVVQKEAGMAHPVGTHQLRLEPVLSEYRVGLDRGYTVTAAAYATPVLSSLPGLP